MSNFITDNEINVKNECNQNKSCGQKKNSIEEKVIERHKKLQKSPIVDKTYIDIGIGTEGERKFLFHFSFNSFLN